MRGHGPFQSAVTIQCEFVPGQSPVSFSKSFEPAAGAPLGRLPFRSWMAAVNWQTRQLVLPEAALGMSRAAARSTRGAGLAERARTSFVPKR